MMPKFGGGRNVEEEVEGMADAPWDGALFEFSDESKKQFNLAIKQSIVCVRPAETSHVTADLLALACLLALT